MMTGSAPRRHPLAIALGALLMLGGCGNTDPRTGAAIGQPVTPPGRSTTPYTDALSCLNQQLQARALLTSAPTRLGAGTLPDATGRISPGLRDMVTTAMVRATRGSSVFVVTESLALAQVPIASVGGPLVTGGTIIGPATMPTDAGALQIYGALTSADRNVAGQEIRAGAGTVDNVFGISQNADISNVGIDMHMAHVRSGAILQSVSNQMTLRSQSRGASADFRIGSVGLNFALSFDEREGVHQAVRTLVELSVLELIGQQARVPYWHCFQLNRGNPLVLRQIAGWFRELSPEALDAYVRQRLRVLGYEVPEAPGSMAPALSRFQREQALVPSGQPSFETFAALVDGQLAAAAPGPTPAALPAPAPAGSVRLRLDVTEVTIAEPLLQLSVQPDRAAAVVCYYRDDTGAVWRLLPNRHQPADRIGADTPQLVPARLGNRPVIQPRRMTAEVGFLCAAGERDWSAVLPAAAWGTDLSRLPGATFEGLRQTLLQAGGPATGVAETTRGRPSGRWSSIGQVPQQ
jgi:hypothetical protein